MNREKGFAFIPLLIVAVLLLGLAFFGFQRFSNNQSTPTPAPQLGMKKVGIIKYLVFLEPVSQGFKKGMVEQGFKEGENITYVELSSNKVDELPGLAKQLIDQDVDLIMAYPVEAAVAAFQETKAVGSNIPVVFSSSDDPIRAGLIKDYKSSGTNATGVTVDFSALTAKKLEFLKELNPSMKRVGVFTAVFGDKAGDAVIMALKDAMAKNGLTMVEYQIKSAPTPESAVEVQQIADGIKPGDIDALFLVPGSTNSLPSSVKILANLGKRLKVPSVGLDELYVSNGVLFSYSHDLFAVGEQTAPFVSRILKGAKPTDLPVEYSKKNLFIINNTTAKDIGITFPPTWVSISDKQIN